MFAVGSAAFSLIGFISHTDGDYGVAWHFWVAPVLTLGIVATLVQLIGMYWLQVGRKETRGQRVSE